MVDGGCDCAASKGSFRRSAKFVISDTKRKCIDNFILFSCVEVGEERVGDAAFIEKPFPAAESSRLLFLTCCGDAFVPVIECASDSSQQEISSSM